MTLHEALNGYVRQQHFPSAWPRSKTHARLSRRRRQQHSWAMCIKARQDYEEDLDNLIPKEPNWDELFARDPQSAHGQQKIYQNIYGKLNCVTRPS